MKKQVYPIILSAVSLVLFAVCIYLAAVSQKASDISAQLQEDKKAIESKLKSKEEWMEQKIAEKVLYQNGQDEYIAELTRQLADCQTLMTDTGEASESGGYYGDTDPYPNLYAPKESEDQNEPEEKKVYLTFDDGPSSLTPKVLDLLDEYGAKATFFVVYHESEEDKKRLSEIAARGHTLAIHSYSHDYEKIYASVDAFLADFQQVYDWVYEACKERPTLFRFPGGSANGKKAVTDEIVKEMQRRGFIYYDWNVSSGDGSNLTETENIIENICSNVGYFEHPVVLMHDAQGKNATLNALPRVLQTLSDKGYSFHSIDTEMEPVQYRRN